MSERPLSDQVAALEEAAAKAREHRRDMDALKAERDRVRDSLKGERIAAFRDGSDEKAGELTKQIAAADADVEEAAARLEGAEQAIHGADRAIVAFKATHVAGLLEEIRPDAERAATTLVDAATQIVEGVTRWHAVESQVLSLLGPGNANRVPPIESWDETARHIRRELLSTPLPPPLPARSFASLAAATAHHAHVRAAEFVEDEAPHVAGAWVVDE